MIKRLIAVFLCVIMTLTLLPATAFAVSSTLVWIAGVELSSSARYYHNGPDGAAGTANADPAGANATLNFATRTLTLNGLYVKDSSVSKTATIGGESTTFAYAIFVNVPLTINVTGDSTVSTSNSSVGINTALSATRPLKVLPNSPPPPAPTQAVWAHI